MFPNPSLLKQIAERPRAQRHVEHAADLRPDGRRVSFCDQEEVEDAELRPAAQHDQGVGVPQTQHVLETAHKQDDAAYVYTGPITEPDGNTGASHQELLLRWKQRLNRRFDKQTEADLFLTSSLSTYIKLSAT